MEPEDRYVPLGILTYQSFYILNFTFYISKMIPRETIDRIYNAIRIEDVVGDYVSLRKRGANMIGLCPFHDEKTGSFTVSPAKGIYKCFGCGKAGNAVNFIMEIEQCSYADALRQLAKKYHIEIVEKEQTAEEKAKENERESLFKTNEWAKEWFQTQMYETQEGQNIGLSYFISRGLHEDTIRRFQLGYSPEKSLLYSAAQKAGYQDEFLEKTGLCGKSERGYYDRFRDRVIFPIFTVSGKVVAFAGRILKNKEHVGKYVNSPDSAIYSKQNELYGLFQAKQAIAKNGCCYLVEGQMDVLSMHQAGIQNVVCSGGTALTHNQVRLIHRFTENVTLIYDGDAAGIHAAIRGIDMLLEEGLNIKVVLLPDGEDPDSFSRKMNASDFIAYIAEHQQDFIRFKTDLLLKDAAGDPIKKSEVVRSIVQSIAVIPDLITRQIYIQSCSAQLAIQEAALLKEMEKMRTKWIEDKKKQRKAVETPSHGVSPTEPEVETSAVPRLPEELPQETPAIVIPPVGGNEGSYRLEQNILNLLQLLMRYGERIYANYDDGTACTVGEFVLADLEADQIRFENPLYQQVLDEYALHMHEPDFCAERFFKYHPDTLVSSLAVDLIADRYPLSKIHAKKNITENVSAMVEMPSDADNLIDLVPHLLCELKLTIVNQQLVAIKHRLKHAQENGAYDELMPILREQATFEQIRQELCKFLGHRIMG